MTRLSPLREYELAVEYLHRADGIYHRATAERNLARARRRLILSALAYVVIASVAVGILWVLLVLAAASSPLPTDIQLPTI